MPSGELRDEPCACPGCRRSTGCYRRVIDYIDAVESIDPEIRFSAHALRLACELAGASTGAWLPVDSQGLTKLLVPYQTDEWGITPQQARTRYVERYWRGDPFSSRNESHRALLTVEDVGGVRAFEATPLGGELMRDLGFAHTIVLNLRRRGRVAAQLRLARTEAAGDFAPAEISLLRRMHPALESALSMDERPRFGTSTAGRGLTKREGQVAALAASGATNQEIAEELMMSVATVKSHLHHAFRRLDVRTRTELARVLH